MLPLLILLLSGCAQFELSAPQMPWEDDPEDVIPPKKIVAFWSDTIMHQQGKPAVRGYGGRVYFYGEEDSEAIEVDGDIIVYAFDADHHDPTNQKPEKKFVFTADLLPQHHSEATDMGPSYSLWLPWDGVQGPTRNISLVVRYEGRDGTVVIADPVTKLLPGTRNQQVQKTRIAQHTSTTHVRPASHDQRVFPLEPSGVSAMKETPARRATVSIDLPPSFMRRLQNAPPQDSTDRASPSAERELTPTRALEPPRSNRDSMSPTTYEAAADRASTAMSRRSTVAAGSPASGYRPTRYRARTTAVPQRDRGPLRRGPHPARWQSGLPLTPRSGWYQPAEESAPVSPERWSPQHSDQPEQHRDS